ncbi:MAG: RNA polymerase sigma factor [Coriobacteriia bacterium]
MSERHIEKLIARAVAGDAYAFGKLYDSYVDRIYAYVRSRITSPHDAEDVTETVFLKAWEAISSYDDRGLPFTAWLFRIARNAIVDGYRRAGRSPQTVDVSAAESLPAADCVDDAVIGAVEAARVRGALSALTDEQAAVVVMRFMWDMSLRDVAAALGKTEGAIKAMQHRALRALAGVLAEESNDEHG